MEIITLADFEKMAIITDKCGVESGYVNDPSDSGGETNHGVTKATAVEHKHLWKKYNWGGDMRTMPVELAMDIYAEGWWDRMNLDKIHAYSPLLCDRMMDFGINAGRGAAVKALQRLLNCFNNQQKLYPDIAEDGGLGNGTISALDAYYKTRGDEGMYNLLIFHMGEQTHHYVETVQEYEKNEKFFYGWANRVARDTKIYAKLLVGG